MDVISVRSGDADLESALQQLPTTSEPYAIVCAGDAIEADVEDGFLRWWSDRIQNLFCGINLVQC